MKQVILEYAGAGIAMLGAMIFFSFMGEFLLGQDGILAKMILMVLGGL